MRSHPKKDIHSCKMLLLGGLLIYMPFASNMLVVVGVLVVVGSS